MTTVEAPERAHTPTPAEIEAVDGGANIGLAALEAEDRHPDPIVAELQNDRDRCAARGDITGAWDHQARVEDLTFALAHGNLHDVEVGG